MKSAPAFFPFIALVTLYGNLALYSQIKLAHILIGQEIIGTSRQNESAGFHNVSIIAYAKGHGCILFNQQYGCVIVPVNAFDGVKNFLYQKRAQSKGRFVQQRVFWGASSMPALSASICCSPPLRCPAN